MFCATTVPDTASENSDEDEQDQWMSLNLLLADSDSWEDPSACAPVSHSESSRWPTRMEIEQILSPKHMETDKDVLELPVNFWQAVDKQIKQCFESNIKHKCWFELANVRFWNKPQHYRFTQACEDAQSFILDRLREGWSSFKIGITSDVHSRWHNDLCGHKGGGWCFMSLLFAAFTGKWQINSFDPPVDIRMKATSSGAMERWLIKAFSGCDEMRNKSEGGEGASNACPHFVYVIWK